MTGAKYLLGERANSLDAIAVHPDVAAWLETAGAAYVHKCYGYQQTLLAASGVQVALACHPHK